MLPQIYHISSIINSSILLPLIARTLYLHGTVALAPDPLHTPVCELYCDRFQTKITGKQAGILRHAHTWIEWQVHNFNVELLKSQSSIITILGLKMRRQRELW